MVGGASLVPVAHVHALRKITTPTFQHILGGISLKLKTSQPNTTRPSHSPQDDQAYEEAVNTVPGESRKHSRSPNHFDAILDHDEATTIYLGHIQWPSHRPDYYYLAAVNAAGDSCGSYSIRDTHEITNTYFWGSFRLTQVIYSYGASLRKQVKKMEITQHAKYTCTFCGKTTVRRKSVGIWNCKGCNRTIAGGAYTVATPAAAAMRSTLRRLREIAEV
ncbi:60S ribosomal protein L37a [Cladobotryum mycophilum]|uniref:60S ribosomal protein L37a n=1 Tax=Cladobotryum mycophilum TaxID=491253 RepID=A0ABR0SEG4_9HYPO